MQINRTPLIEIPFNNFQGGYAGAKGSNTLAPNEAQDLDNLIILPGGGGIRNRRGNIEESTSGNLSTWTNPVQGAISFKKTSTEHIIYAMELGTTGNLSIIEHDISGSTHTVRKTVTGADGADIFVTMCKFKDLVIGTTEEQTAPFKVDMSGTPSGGDLGGSPPSGKFCIAWNSVVWIGNTSTDPSKLSYCVLDTPEDWTGATSGFVNPMQKDGDELITCVPISNNVMLYFKRHSIHQVVGRAAPFAVFPLFTGTGCAGIKAAVEADGLVHFITPEGKMRITDGTRIYDDKDLPQLSYADDLWALVPKTRLAHVVGFRQIGSDYDHIVFLVSLGTAQATNNYAIVWDFKNKCWLKHSTGYNGNAACTVNDGTAYMGGYAGRLYKLNAATQRDDSMETPVIDGSNLQVLPTAADPVAWYWRTDDLSLQSLQNIVQVERVNLLVEYQATGSLRMSYGYDGLLDNASIVFSVPSTGFTLGTTLLGTGILGDSTRYRTRTFRPLGRGQTFNLKLSGEDAVATKLTKFTLAGRQHNTKVHEVR